MFTRYLNNCGRPESNKLGRFVLKSMNKGHAYIYRWLLGNVHLPEIGIVLDVGCGGGALMERILNEFPSIKTYGIDISDESVRMCGELKKKHPGRIEVRKADAVSLPFPDETFSLALSCESIYFWKAPDKALSEICRTLISGSWLAVAVETSDKNKARIWSDRISGMTVYSPGELRSLFCNAGFVHIESQMKGQACLVKGMKP